MKGLNFQTKTYQSLENPDADWEGFSGIGELTSEEDECSVESHAALEQNWGRE
ncbi:molybdopterin oxidoreductase [Marssonina coronariae]|uniref:Molybdopterin oxidoreductase n=1 Tax=Diplocarpon coronariae TaxID=2795749 RepID=A0A218YSX2_9HELO|nr:molybdopterin oxidoreductase [Marssonina coronariae]